MNAAEFRQLIRHLAPQWISLLLDLLASLYTYAKQRSPEGLYEFLEYDFKLELLGTQGRTARWTKHQRVKFLQDHVIAFEDYAWGDGNVLAEYRCSPGFVADRYREGPRWNILISLRESKRRGDVQDFYIESRAENALTRKSEWFQVELRHRTRAARLSVVFPKKRPCIQAVLVERTRDRTTYLDRRNITVLPDGRQLVSWETVEPRLFETYTLKWTW